MGTYFSVPVHKELTNYLLLNAMWKSVSGLDGYQYPWKDELFVTSLTFYIVVVQLLSCVNSLRPHGQHARLPCPSLSPGVCSNLCLMSQWCHPTISSSVTPFSSCLQSFPVSRSFPNELALCIRWPKYWSVSLSPFNEYSLLISFHWLVTCLPFNCSTTIQKILANEFVSSKLVFCMDGDANYLQGVICTWSAAPSHPLLLALLRLSLHQLWLSYALKG